MGSPFADLSTERPSVVVDRVHLKLTTATPTVSQPVVPGADFLAFCSASGGAPGSSIKILERPDPITEPSDPGQALLLWGLGLNLDEEIGGGRFNVGVGYRVLYPDPPRTRDPGEPDSLSFIWKMWRVLVHSQSLTDAIGADPQTTHIVAFKGQPFLSIDVKGVCREVIQGEILYQVLLDKDAI